jgi:flagellar motor switch protein FliM
MMRPLSGGDFKPRPRVSVTALPATARLASLLAESCTKALARFSAASWRVALDRIEETGFPPDVAYARSLRFESANGSLTMQLMLDRPLVSATVEALMGGSGTEAPFDMGDRPLSKIERGMLDLVNLTLAHEICRALSNHFGREFTHFEEEGAAETPSTVQERASFRFLVNVFGCSGEIRLSMARSELAQQIRATMPDDASAATLAAQQTLQRQVRQSHVELTVTLGAETLAVADIAGLRPGMMIELSSSVKTPVMVWSGGVAAFRGSLSRAGDRLAVTVTTAVT